MVPVHGHFIDTWVFYESEHEPGMWVAHSLNTDQIGMGTCVLDAYVALHRAMHVLLQAAASDPRIDAFRPAPSEIRRIRHHARPLPREVIEIAEMRMQGKRPRRKPKAPYGGRVRKLTAPVELEFAGA